ncbi:MAG: NAD(P)H-quinone oxidoreductase subunit F [Synechococcales cyanobacterium RM1_1_8]|nr:NAD(P)H-quinone oxidoreductase subunit F [Synechococcales cyanobacterium RM1_1_8]
MFHALAQSSWLIPCYPLLGASLSLLWFPSVIRRTGPRPAGYVNLLFTLVALFHSTIALSACWGEPARFIQLPWLTVADLQLSFPLELSPTTLGACTLVTLLNFLVQVYAIGYLEMDWGWGRLYALLALFEAGMVALVLCDSLFFSYMLLEILTLGTYLIVGFWFNQSLVVTGARDAFLTKRVGDLVLLMGVLALYPLTGSWNFSELALWAQSPEAAAAAPLTITLIAVALICGPLSKCAQFPLHLWLDEAMEGPLPTTILRNSVVVTTGAWVLVKLAPVIALSSWASSFMIVIGSLSALGGSLISSAQVDAKRVPSYLTSVYMGIVFIAVGSGQAEAALLLVFTYAIATALLIMSIGSVILTVISQDITQLGGLWSRRPVTGLSFLVGSAGLVALPPFGGFWALMALLTDFWEQGQWGLVAVVVVTNGVVGFALMRMFGLMFAGDRQSMTARAPEPIWLMVVPMTLLTGLTLHLPLVMGWLGILPEEASWLSPLALVLLSSSLAGLGVGGFCYVFPRVTKPGSLLPKQLNDLFAYDFYTPRVYQVTAIALVDILSKLTDWLDRYVVDGLVNLVGLTPLFSGEALKYGNSGKLQFYALTIAFFVAAISLYMGWNYLPDLLSSPLPLPV